MTIETDHTYMTQSTGTCYIQAQGTAVPDALASPMHRYVLVYIAAPTPPDLATQMAKDQGFMQQVRAGWDDLEQGRVSSLDDVKRRLGGV